MTLLELSDMTSGPEGAPDVEGVTLRVEPGTVLAVLGRGTEALLRTVVGLQPVTSGEITVDDTQVTTLPARSRNTSLVLADHPLHERLDVHDNLAFADRLRKGVDREALAESIDDVAGVLALDALLDARVDELDARQRQRVAIARALVRQDALCVFDDVFRGQDEQTRAQVRSVVLDWLRDAGRTTLFGTSDAAEALVVGDAVAVLRDGRVRQVGSPDDVYARPADIGVAAQVGAMNLLAARRHEDQLVAPMATLLLDDAWAALLGDRQEVLVGLRPEHLLDATSAAGREVTDRVEFTSRVEDVEWRGATQAVYVDAEVDEETFERLARLEDAYDATLFQDFCVAELPGAPRLRAGQSVRLVADRADVVLFDLETGERLDG